MFADVKKSCPGSIKLCKKSFPDFNADVPNILHTVHPLFLFFFQPNLGLSGQRLTQEMGSGSTLRAVHLEILQLPKHHQGDQENLCMKGHTTYHWIDSGLNIVKAGKDLINT